MDWNSKPERPVDPNPLFATDNDESYVVKGLNPMQRQRQADGSPYTNHGRSGLAPADYALFLDDGHLNKSMDEKTDPPISVRPDEVVKAFLAGVDSK